MAEYIEREKIFPNGVFYVSNEHPEKSIDELIKRIYDIHAADVVEVVRCKDCKYFSSFEYSEQQGLCINHSGLNGIDACVSEDDFCSYGERKQDNDN